MRTTRLARELGWVLRCSVPRTARSQLAANHALIVWIDWDRVLAAVQRYSVKAAMCGVSGSATYNIPTPARLTACVTASLAWTGASPG